MRRIKLRRLGYASAALLLVGAGCQARATVPGASVADTLRERVVDLERQIIALERRNTELEEALAATSEGEPEDVRFATPHVAAIEIEPLSHLRTGAEGNPVLFVYVKPQDGYGRFVQLVGRLSINAAVLPPDAGAFTIGQVTLGPIEVRDAYRSSFAGTHYTVKVPVDPSAAAGHDECLVHVEYVDGRSGRRHTADRAIALAD